jgi:hypothetical protein
MKSPPIFAALLQGAGRKPGETSKAKPIETQSAIQGSSVLPLALAMPSALQAQG